MTVLRSQIKNIAFYSGFQYERPIVSGTFTSHDNGFGGQVVDGSTFAIPSSVQNLPPYVEFYVEAPTGVFRLPEVSDGLQLGNDSTTVYADGFDNFDPTFVRVFKIHFNIYDTQVS